MDRCAYVVRNEGIEINVENFSFVHEPPVQVVPTHVRSASLSVFVLTAVNDGGIDHVWTVDLRILLSTVNKIMNNRTKNWQPNDHNLIYVNVFIHS